MLRVTINGLMVAVSGVAGLLAVYRSFGIFALTLSTLTLSLSLLVWFMVRTYPPISSWLFAVSIGSGSVLNALICAYIYDYPGIGIMILLSLITTPLAMGSGLVWISSRPQGHRLQDLVARLVVVGLGLMPLSMSINPWPLHLTFALSRPSMERIADGVAAGRSIKFPARAGFYVVVDAKQEPRNGNVALFIDANPAGRSGFVRVKNPLDPFGPMAGLNADEPVGDPWRYQIED